MHANSHIMTNEEILRQNFKQVGLKATRPRLLVLGLLQELAGHHSVDELVDLLFKRGTPLPRASVYNAINACSGRGLVMFADAGPGPVLYEANSVWHHHFVCTTCGVILDIPCLKGEKPCLLPDRVPGQVEEAQIIFRGICNECLAKNPADSPEIVYNRRARPRHHDQ